jgi:hypothetical protein
MELKCTFLSTGDNKAIKHNEESMVEAFINKGHKKRVLL